MFDKVEWIKLDEAGINTGESQMPDWVGYVISDLRPNSLIVLRRKLKFRDRKRLVRLTLAKWLSQNLTMDLLSAASALWLASGRVPALFQHSLWCVPLLGLGLSWDLSFVGPSSPASPLGSQEERAVVALGHPLSAGDCTVRLPLLPLVAISCSWTSPSWDPLPTLSQS